MTAIPPPVLETAPIKHVKAFWTKREVMRYVDLLESIGMEYAIEEKNSGGILKYELTYFGSSQ